MINTFFKTNSMLKLYVQRPFSLVHDWTKYILTKKKTWLMKLWTLTWDWPTSSPSPARSRWLDSCRAKSKSGGRRSRTGWRWRARRARPPPAGRSHDCAGRRRPEWPDRRSSRALRPSGRRRARTTAGWRTAAGWAGIWIWPARRPGWGATGAAPWTTGKESGRNGWSNKIGAEIKSQWKYIINFLGLIFQYFIRWFHWTLSIAFTIPSTAWRSTGSAIASRSTAPS